MAMCAELIIYSLCLLWVNNIRVRNFRQFWFAIQLLRICYRSMVQIRELGYVLFLLTQRAAWAYIAAYMHYAWPMENR